MSNVFNYRPQTKLREGYVFTGVCDSVHRWGWVPGPRGCLIRGGCAWFWGGMWVWSGGCLVETLPDGYCCGRYQSHWNAFLFKVPLGNVREQTLYLIFI